MTSAPSIADFLRGTQTSPSIADFLHSDMQPIPDVAPSSFDVTTEESGTAPASSVMSDVTAGAQAEDAPDRDTLLWRAHAGLAFLKDTSTDGQQLPPELHSAMLDADWTEEELNEFPVTLQWQIGERRLAAARAAREPQAPPASVTSDMTGQPTTNADAPPSIAEFLDATASHDAAHVVPPSAGAQPDAEWQQFPAESGTLDIPRVSMPQIRSEHRGAMTRFLTARGITHEAVEVAPNALKPTQAEYSPAKVEKARGFEGPPRSILISSDGHLLDGHHQWLKDFEDAPDEPIPAIQFNAPIRQLLLEASQFPSSTTDRASVQSGDVAGGSAQLEKSPQHGESVTSRAVVDADFSDMEQAERAARGAGGPADHIAIPVQLAPGEDQSVEPDELARRAIYSFAETHKIPMEYASQWIVRQEEAGNLKLYDLHSGGPTTIKDLIEEGKQTGDYDAANNRLTLHGELPFFDQLRNDYEAEKGYVQRIKDDYNDPTKKAGAVALDIVGPPVAAAAHYGELASRPVQALSTGLSGVSRAIDPTGAVRLSEWFAGKDSRSAWEILRDTPSAAYEELTTGHTREGYENPLSATVDNLTGEAADQINQNLRPIIREVTNIIGDPLIALGVIGKAGRAARAGEALAEGAQTDARLAEIASTIEQRIGVRPTLERLADGAIKVTAEMDGQPASFTIKPGGGIAASLEAGAAGDAAPSSLMRRVGRETLDVLSIPRTVQASYDLSAAGRQGLVLATNHPVRAARAFGAQVKALVSKEAAEQTIASIFNSPMQPLREQSGLFLSSLENSSLANREEVFMSRIAEGLPGVKQSERAYSVFLDSLRADCFDSYVASHPHATPEDLKGIAKFINFSTGRGSLGKLEGTKAAQVLSQAFFSPRLTISRAQLLTTPFTGSAAARKYAARHLVVFVGSGLSTLALAKAAGLKVQADPRSSAFGKIQVGHQQIDIWGGFVQPARYIAQLITKESKTEGGNIVERGRGETVKNFTRSRLSPQAAILWDVATGETFMGEKTTPKTIAKEHLLPFAANDLIEAIRDDRAQGRSGARGAAIGSLSLFGVGVQTHTPKPAKPITDGQKQYIYNLADAAGYINEDDESAQKFAGKKVNELSTREASELIDALKKKRAEARR